MLDLGLQRLCLEKLGGSDAPLALLSSRKLLGGYAGLGLGVPLGLLLCLLVGVLLGLYPSGGFTLGLLHLSLVLPVLLLLAHQVQTGVYQLGSATASVRGLSTMLDEEPLKATRSVVLSARGLPK